MLSSFVLGARFCSFLALGLFVVDRLGAHPADTNGDSALSAAEVAAFVQSEGSGAELSRQAVNVWKHGERYRALNADSHTYYVPDPSSEDEYVAVATLSPAAATLVRVHGLPANANGYQASYYDPSVEDVVFDGSVVEEGGKWFLAVPTHPVDAIAGGELEFAIHPADEEPTPGNSFRIGTVTVEGLTPAPGTIGAYRQKVDAFVSLLESDSDIDFSEYFAGGPREFGPFENRGQQNLILIVRYLQDPGFPQGLVELDEEILDDSSPFLVGLRAEIDALMAQSGMIDWIDQFALDPYGSASAAASVKTTVDAPAPAEGTPSAFESPTDAASLSQLMGDQYVAEQMLKDPLFGMGVGGGTAAIGLAGAPGQIVSAEVGLTISALRLSNEEKANTYPREGSITASFGETNFYADDCDHSAGWTATASVSSRGWSTDGAQMDVAVSLIGAAGGVASSVKYLKEGSKVAQIGDDGLKAALSKKATEVPADAAEFGSLETAKAIANEDASHDVPAQSWSDITLGPDYAKMVQVGGPVVDVDGDSYAPVDTGEAMAYISAGQPNFPPGALQPSETVSIKVEAASLTLSGCPPSPYTPGELYTITASVAGLRDKDVPISWESTAGALTPVENSVPGQSQAIWEAPNPAPSDVVTLTATADAEICIPHDASAPTASCSTRGSDYELVLTPAKDCYETGDVVTLTFIDTNNPDHAPGTDFELVTGVANLTKTGDNTATVSVESSGEVGVVARLISDPNEMQSAVMTFGCGEGLGLTLHPDDEADVLVFTQGGTAYTLYGEFTASGGRLTAHFDADSTYQYMLSVTGPEATQPVYGEVGADIESQARIINTDLSVTLDFAYAEIDCPVAQAPHTICFQAQDTTAQSVIIDGLPNEYELRPDLTGTAIGPIYMITVIPTE